VAECLHAEFGQLHQLNRVGMEKDRLWIIISQMANLLKAYEYACEIAQILADSPSP